MGSHVWVATPLAIYTRTCFGFPEWVCTKCNKHALSYTRPTREGCSDIGRGPDPETAGE
jgi:hypothetical protein